MKIKECILIEPFICNKDESIVDVAKKLRSTTLRHIFVVDDNTYPIGIISVMDINNRVVAEAKDNTKVKAEDIMTKTIMVVDSEDDVDVTAKMMIEQNKVMNPVVKDKKMVGIIAIYQLLKNSKVDDNE